MSDSDPEIPGEEAEAQPTAAELEAAGQNSMFGAAPEAPQEPDPKRQPEQEPEQEPALGAAPPTAPAPAPVSAPAPASTHQPYRVLARKYRPQTFSELIGQEPMVQTLGNAIRRDRLAHAFLMTGVRGVGKTSTARLIAKALNCVGPDGQGGPTIDPCGQCEPCTAIAEGRHIDVIEMDAASHTGVDDVREIIEAVRYAAVSARYKIYIIDEVHMLSRNAFNALLKTLEEPPAHVKFLFATTEVDKLPVTVLSRTQRFDLRRIPADLLQSHFGWVCSQEGVAADDEALAMIAAVAEGSVRDGLSILDQAIAHADMDEGGAVSAGRVRAMLGLADRGAQRRLFGHILEADPQALIGAVEEQYALGVEPLALMRSLLDITHKVTVAQITGAADAPSAEERKNLEEWAGRLSAPQLHRLWQLVLKGYDEVRMAPDPLVSAQMALLRALHASDLPDPGKLAKTLEELAARPAGAATAGTAASGAPAALDDAPAPAAQMDWADLVSQVDRAGQLRVAQTMRDWVRVIELADGKLTYALAPGLSDDPRSEFQQVLKQVTDRHWEVVQSENGGTPTLREQAEALKSEQEAALRRHPLVEATMAAFPDAEILPDTPDNGQEGNRNWSKYA